LEPAGVQEGAIGVELEVVDGVDGGDSRHVAQLVGERLRELVVLVDQGCGGERTAGCGNREGQGSGQDEGPSPHGRSLLRVEVVVEL
jgi:hypothetical protein